MENRQNLGGSRRKSLSAPVAPSIFLTDRRISRKDTDRDSTSGRAGKPTSPVDSPPSARSGRSEPSRHRNHPRHRRAVRRGQPTAAQETQRSQGQGRRQSFLRAVHAHARRASPSPPSASAPTPIDFTARQFQPQPRARHLSTRPRTSRRWASTWWWCVIRCRARRTCWLNTCTRSIVNAGDGAHEHPTQGLLDIFTIRRIQGPG